MFGVFSLGFGMMVGTVPTSVPQLILLGNWLLEFDFKRKWAWLKNNKLFWICGAIFLIHVVGLLYTQDMPAGIKDVRTKLPLLFLPLVFFTSQPLSRKEFHGVLFCFLGGALVNTAWCLFYSFVLHHHELNRSASRFMSHIRLGLYLNMAILCCAYFAVLLKENMKKTGLVILGLYFLFAMFALGLASGLANFLILAFLAAGVLIYKQRPLIKITALLALIAGLAFIASYVSAISKTQLQVQAGPQNQQQLRSASNRPYVHFDTKGQKENGNYVFVNIQLDELKQEWAKQFPADSFNFYPPHGYNINRYEVLIRYMASRALNKDSVGMAQLNDEDKTNIRNNVCNYRYNSWNYLHRRIYELVCEYDDFLNKRNVNGHSLTMRLYFWNAALQIVKQHPVFGVGTGDVQAELNKVYDESDSPLEKEWYKRPHNQFLTVTVALGVVGLLVLCISLVYPAIALRRKLSILYWPFFILAIVSFFLEDTLETQAGLSFYAVFNTLFVSFAYFNKQQEKAVL